jgi:ribulose-bisphosphate carboxylase large chain
MQYLDQDWGSLKPVIPVASGGLHPGTIHEVMDVYNTTDMALQLGGGIHGHPGGTYAGAKATIQAIEAWKDGVTLEDKAKSSPELKQALDKWGILHPV